MQRVTVLGSTGSIGVSTLDVLARHPDRFEVFALSAASRWRELGEQCLRHNPRYAVMTDENAAEQLDIFLCDRGSDVEVLAGDKALAQIASDGAVDAVMAAIVGAAGLLPTFAAVEAGKRVLLANKEVLVMAGQLFMAAARQNGAEILPIDSEHNAIFQCLPLAGPLAAGLALEQLGVRKVVLTASGGPFLHASAAQLEAVTPAEACNHPNWSMGRKISVDSATMMNKGLEFIEACWLFNANASQIEVLIHPQSVLHSMVEYIDGSVLAQLGNPDMRTPIAHALGLPERIVSGVGRLDLAASARLDFEAPDLQRFPCLALAQTAAQTGGSVPCVLNAANEVAVEAFLRGQLSFNHIATVIERVLAQVQGGEPLDLSVVQHADALARHQAQREITLLGGRP